MSDKKPGKKIRRRRTTGRVAGTTQSVFATNSMSSILKQQAEAQARKNARDAKASDGSDEPDRNDEEKEDAD